VADGQLSGITVFPGNIEAVFSLSNIAACFETTSSTLKPSFAFFIVDNAIDDVVIESFPNDMMR
jgi:hypothetical protein